MVSPTGFEPVLPDRKSGVLTVGRQGHQPLGVKLVGVGGVEPP
jgi:hypothetical protein